MTRSPNNRLIRPFSATPNPKFLYRSQSMDHALQAVSRCIERAEGVACVIGSSGLGKSLLCHTLVQSFEKRLSVVLLNSARLCTRRALLQNLLFELHLPYRDREEGELRLGLTEFLRSSSDCPEGLLLVIDEAQALPTRLLEEIRMLTNFVMDGRPCVRLVLAGNHVLEERLATADFESFNQRIVTRSYLDALTSDETRNYVQEQLSIAPPESGCYFEQDALKKIHTATHGVPRLVNQLCDHALYLAERAGITPISGHMIQEAWADLQQLPAPWQTELNTSESGSSTTSVIEFGELSDEGTVSVGELTSDVSSELWAEETDSNPTQSSPSGAFSLGGEELPSETLQPVEDSYEDQATSEEADSLYEHQEETSGTLETSDVEPTPLRLLPETTGSDLSSETRPEESTNVSDDGNVNTILTREFELSSPSDQSESANSLDSGEGDSIDRSSPDSHRVSNDLEAEASDDFYKGEREQTPLTEDKHSESSSIRLEQDSQPTEQTTSSVAPIDLDSNDLFSTGDENHPLVKLTDNIGLNLDAADYLGVERPGLEISTTAPEGEPNNEASDQGETVNDEPQGVVSSREAYVDFQGVQPNEEDTNLDSSDAESSESSSLELAKTPTDDSESHTNQEDHPSSSAGANQPVQPRNPFDEEFTEEVLIEDAYRSTVSSQLATTSWTQPQRSGDGDLLPHLESLQNGTFERLPFAVDLKLARLSNPKPDASNSELDSTREKVEISDELPELVFESEKPAEFEVTVERIHSDSDSESRLEDAPIELSEISPEAQAIDELGRQQEPSDEATRSELDLESSQTPSETEIQDQDSRVVLERVDAGSSADDLTAEVNSVVDDGATENTSQDPIAEEHIAEEHIAEEHIAEENRAEENRAEENRAETQWTELKNPAPVESLLEETDEGDKLLSERVSLADRFPAISSSFISDAGPNPDVPTPLADETSEASASRESSENEDNQDSQTIENAAVDTNVVGDIEASKLDENKLISDVVQSIQDLGVRSFETESESDSGPIGSAESRASDSIESKSTSDVETTALTNEISVEELTAEPTVDAESLGTFEFEVSSTEVDSPSAEAQDQTNQPAEHQEFTLSESNAGNEIELSFDNGEVSVDLPVPEEESKPELTIEISDGTVESSEPLSIDELESLEFNFSDSSETSEASEVEFSFAEDTAEDETAGRKNISAKLEPSQFGKTDFEDVPSVENQLPEMGLAGSSESPSLADSNEAEIRMNVPPNQESERGDRFSAGLEQVAEFEEIDQRLLKEIVSFRDAIAFDPATDPVMPEFRPPAVTGEAEATRSDRESASSEESTGGAEQQASTADFSGSEESVQQQQTAPEIVLVDPPLPQSKSASADSYDTSEAESDGSREPSGRAHREDYNSLFDRLKG